MRAWGMFLVCLGASCAARSAPQNLQASDYFVIVTAGTAAQLKLDAKPPQVHISPVGQVGAIFSLYNMGKKASMPVTVSAEVVVTDPTTQKKATCYATAVVQAGAPDGVEAGGTWSSGEIMFTEAKPPCPPCVAGACRGAITISYVNRFVSSENGVAKSDTVPVTHTYTFEATVEAPGEPAEAPVE